MADFFKPRRGTQLKAIEALNGENKLRAGELFFELEYEGSTKTVKSGRIMIGDGTSNYADLVTNDRYVFNPDDYMGVTSKFEPTPSTETTITDNRNIINSANTNIKEKMGAIDATIDLLDENKSEKTHNHTTADITNFVANVKTIKVNNASTADFANKAAANVNGVDLSTFVKNISTNSSSAHFNDLVIETSSGTKYIQPHYAMYAGTANYGKFNGFGKSKTYMNPSTAAPYKLLEPNGTFETQGDSYSALIYAQDSYGMDKLYFYTRYVGESGFSSVGKLVPIVNNEMADFSFTYDNNKTKINLVAKNSEKHIFVHIFVMSGNFKLFGE